MGCSRLGEANHGTCMGAAARCALPECGYHDDGPCWALGSTLHNAPAGATQASAALPKPTTANRSTNHQTAQPPNRRYRHCIVVVEDRVPNSLSSTRVRSEVAHGRSVKYLVPDGVADYLACHPELYAAPR